MKGNNKVSICAYGDSGRGKSTMGRLLLKWIRANINPNAKASVYSVEHTSAYESSVNDGLIRIWNMNNRQEPFATVDDAANGYWPEDVDDPKSKLIKPTNATFNEYMLNIYEGLSTFSDYLAGSYVTGGLAARAGRKERIGPAEETVSFQDGRLSVGGSARTHYNIVQTNIRGAVAVSHKLPVFNFWTAHEERAKDDRTGMPIVGPEVFGLKATQHVPKWFANILHLSMTPVKKTTKDGDIIEPDFRLWLKIHYDPAVPGIPFIAKNSIDVEYQKEIPTFIDGGALGIGRFMDMLVKYNQIRLT